MIVEDESVSHFFLHYHHFRYIHRYLYDELGKIENDILCDIEITQILLYGIIIIV